MRPATACALAAVAALHGGCGGDDRASARDVAETYVAAVAAEDWKAACEVSVREELDDCVDALREVYGDPATDVPSVERTQEVVEEVDGRNLVHLEYVLIK